MNKLLVLLLLLSSCQVSFAKVIEIETPPDVCAVVTTHMLYLDSKGSKHDLEYNIMGFLTVPSFSDQT